MYAIRGVDFFKPTVTKLQRNLASFDNIVTLELFNTYAVELWSTRVIPARMPVESLGLRSEKMHFCCVAAAISAAIQQANHSCLG